MADNREVNIIVRAVDAVTGQLRSIGDQVSSFGSHVQGVFTAIGAAIVGSAFGRFLEDSVKNAFEAEKSIARLDAALQNVGLSYQAVAPQVEQYLSTLQRTTRYSDEDGREALTKLVAMTHNYSQSLRDMQVVADVAAFKQITLSEAAVIVAKAHEGSGRELKAFNIHVKEGVDAVPQLTERLKGFEENSRTSGDISCMCTSRKPAGGSRTTAAGN